MINLQIDDKKVLITLSMNIIKPPSGTNCSNPNKRMKRRKGQRDVLRFPLPNLVKLAANTEHSKMGFAVPARITLGSTDTHNGWEDRFQRHTHA